MIVKKYRRTFSILILAAIVAIIFRTVLFASYAVSGESMEPTLYDGNMLMVNKVVYDIKDVDRFDVVVFHATQQEDYVKRVVGLPGDEIQYKDDKLYVNGDYVDEPFLEPFSADSESFPYTKDFTLEEKTGATKVPDDKLFVMGDNRDNSLDSRAFGFISQDQLVGKVDVKYWPLSQASFGMGA